MAVSSCRYHAASALGANTRSHTLLGQRTDHPVIKCSRGVHYPRSGNSAGTTSSSPRTASRSDTSQAATRTLSPNYSSSTATPVRRRARPRRVASNRLRTPDSTTRCAQQENPARPRHPSPIPCPPHPSPGRVNTILPMTRLAHEPESLRRTTHIPRDDRQWLQLAALEQPHNSQEHLLDPIKTSLP